MRLTSPAFDDGGPIPALYTCDGDNISPPLEWAGVPPLTLSLALTCRDPDAPRGTFTHWLMWNIDPRLVALAPGEVPVGARQGRNDFGHVGYDGPCPPPGDGPHRYQFRLYAVSEVLPLADGASVTLLELEDVLGGRTIGFTELLGTYER